MRRQYPNAVQCPRCRARPVIPENCYDLQAHHGESSNIGRSRISNACPSCGFFSRERGDGQWLSVGSVPFSMGRSFFLRAASTFMCATTLLAKLITKSIWVFVGKSNSEEGECLADCQIPG
jgi:hypothetical protein